MPEKTRKARKARRPHLFYVVGRQCNRGPLEVIDGPIPTRRSDAEGVAALVSVQGWCDVQVIAAGQVARLFGGAHGLAEAAAQANGHVARMQRGVRDYDWR